VFPTRKLPFCKTGGKGQCDIPFWITEEKRKREKSTCPEKKTKKGPSMSPLRKEVEKKGGEKISIHHGKRGGEKK